MSIMIIPKMGTELKLSDIARRLLSNVLSQSEQYAIVFNSFICEAEIEIPNFNAICY